MPKKDKEQFGFLIRTISPVHVGFGKRRHILDLRKRPIIPAIALEATIHTYARRLAYAMNLPEPRISSTDAYMLGEPMFRKMLPITASGKLKSEFVGGWFGVHLSCPTEDIPLLFASLYVVELLGIGANTSAGYGRVNFIIVEQTIRSKHLRKITPLLTHFFPHQKRTGMKRSNLPNLKSIPSAPMRFIQNILNKVVWNWNAWSASINPEPLRELVVFNGEFPQKTTALLIRRFLRKFLSQLWKPPHEWYETCPPGSTPCRVCYSLGSLMWKSRWTVRAKPTPEKTYATIIVDNPTDDEIEVLQQMLGFGIERRIRTKDLFYEPGELPDIHAIEETQTDKSTSPADLPLSAQRILFLATAHPGISVPMIQQITQYSRPTINRALKTLTEAGMVKTEPGQGRGKPTRVWPATERETHETPM